VHAFSNLTEGGLNCCHSTYYDGGKCPLGSSNSQVESNQTYYIRYTLKWVDFNPATTLPLEVISFDATDNNTKWGDFANWQGGFAQSHAAMREDPTSVARIEDIRSGDFNHLWSCHIEWYVPACKPGEDCILTLKNSWEVPWPMHVVFLRNHFHAGGINMTTYTKDFRCVGNSTYDDQKNLVDISTCAVGGASNGVVQVPAGEKLYVESVYQQDSLPHYGVMSMSFVYAYIPRQNEVQV